MTYGGGGLDSIHAIILEEEVDRFDLSLPPYYDSGGRLGSATILVWGTEEQKQAFLPPIYTGEVRTWQLLTEPGAGSDLAGVTHARPSATATSTSSTGRRSSSAATTAPTASG